MAQMTDALKSEVMQDVADIQRKFDGINEHRDTKFGITGRVQVSGKWLLSDTDKLMGVFKNLNKDTSKRYVKVNKRTLDATEEAGPLPLDGEADCIWVDKLCHYGDIIV